MPCGVYETIDLGIRLIVEVRDENKEWEKRNVIVSR